MNILHTECSMNWGGQEFRTLLEHNYLNKNGHVSWIFCHPNSQLYSKSKGLGINVISINLNSIWRIDSAIKILLFCNKNKIDIINSHGSKDSILNLLSFFCGIPLIRSRQITNPIKKTFGYEKGCTHIIAAAQAIKSLLMQAGVTENKISVIGEGVDLAEFHPNVESDYLKKEFTIHLNDKVVVNIGMIREDKGQHSYLEAAKLILTDHPTIKFFIVGEGTGDKAEEKRLRFLLTEYGLEQNFYITGYRNDIAAFTHLADLIVIASTGTEAQSRVAPQAFATQKTVVSTNVGGLTEIVKHDYNGLLISPNNPEAMAAAILKILHNPELKTQLEQNAYLFAQQELSFEFMMQKIINLYQKYCL